MIKASSPKRFTQFVKFNDEILKHKNIMSIVRHDLKKSIKLPKNTLRSKIIHGEIGYHGNGFVLRVLTMILVFEVITFKRK